MKKLAVVVLILAMFGAGVFMVLGKKKPVTQTTAPTPKPKLTIPANQLPVTSRPYVTLQPTSAREVVMTIGDLIKKADSVDYELQYSAGDKEEAAIGSMDFGRLKPPYSKTILLGSKSGGGKITYHENVTGGTLVLSFYDENYKLANEWSYIANKPTTTSYSSRDGKFDLEVGKLLKGVPYVIVYNNPGLPASATKAVLAGPYSVSTTASLANGKATLTMRLTDAKPAEILGWTGKEWKTFPTKVDGTSATAQVDLLPTYVAVEK